MFNWYYVGILVSESVLLHLVRASCGDGSAPTSLSGGRAREKARSDPGSVDPELFFLICAVCNGSEFGVFSNYGRKHSLDALRRMCCFTGLTLVDVPSAPIKANSCLWSGLQLN